MNYFKSKTFLIILLTLFIFIFLTACKSSQEFENVEEEIEIPITPPQIQIDSHFGIHISGMHPSQTLVYIKELGNIYVREELSENAGWYIIKKGRPDSVANCMSCCVKTKFTDCSCSEGIYYCNDNPDKNTIRGISLYDSNFPLLVTILTTSNSPEIAPDFKTDYSQSDKTTYWEYLDYLNTGMPKVKYWQIANEVDLDFWSGTQQDYADMVKASYQKIKSNCPDCKVGISFNKELNDLKEWETTIKNICPYFDFIDAHVLPNGLNQEKLENYNTGWDSICPNKELISTESGLPSSQLNKVWGQWEFGLTQEKQAKDMIKYFTILFNNGYNKVFWFLSDWDFEEIPNDLFEHTGLLTQTNQKKQSFYTYKILIEKLDRFTKITKLQQNQYKYSFEHKNPIYVVWGNDLTLSTLSQEITGTLKTTNYLGQQEIIDSSKIILTNSPIFIEILEQ